MSAAKKKPIKRRDSFFGQQVIRLMTKTCVANELGASAFTLLAVVSAQQDAAGGRAVTYYTNQIMPLIGVHKWDTLDAIRQRCVDAGWLEYQSPAKGERKPGLYAVKIPVRFAHLSDSRCDEGSPSQSPFNGERTGDSGHPEKGDRSGDRPGERMGDRTGYRMGEPPSSPSPSPSTSSITPKSPTGDFERFWSVFPSGRKQGKDAALKAWAAAVKRADPETIIAAATEYAASRVAQGEYVKGPAPWLNQGCWNDDRAAWNRSSSKQVIGAGQVHDPEAAKRDPNHGRM